MSRQTARRRPVKLAPLRAPSPSPVVLVAHDGESAPLALEWPDGVVMPGDYVLAYGERPRAGERLLLVAFDEEYAHMVDALLARTRGWGAVAFWKPASLKPIWRLRCSIATCDREGHLVVFGVEAERRAAA